MSSSSLSLSALNNITRPTVEWLLKANTAMMNTTLRTLLWQVLLGGGVFLGMLLSISKLFTPSFDYRGRHVLVTGGSSGIGLAAAIQYAQKGAKVTIVARTQKKLDMALKELQPHCEAHGQKASAISCDTSKSLQECEDKLCNETVGVVDVLVNCAGTSIAGSFDELPAHHFESMLKTNVLGSVYPTRALLPGMKQAGKGGRIVFVASQVAQVAIYGYTAYAASKWALRGLAEALQMEVKPHGIMVSVCYPPDTDTPGYEAEMLTKPDITKKLSESGDVFTSDDVASDIVKFSGRGYFGISTGFDGWLLKQLHPGMSPCNNLWEVWQGILFSGLARFISVFYIASWDADCRAAAEKDAAKKHAANKAK